MASNTPNQSSSNQGALDDEESFLNLKTQFDVYSHDIIKTLKSVELSSAHFPGMGSKQRQALLAMMAELNRELDRSAQAVNEAQAQGGDVQKPLKRINAFFKSNISKLLTGLTDLSRFLFIGSRAPFDKGTMQVAFLKLADSVRPAGEPKTYLQAESKNKDLNYLTRMVDHALNDSKLRDVILNTPRVNEPNKKTKKDDVARALEEAKKALKVDNVEPSDTLSAAINTLAYVGAHLDYDAGTARKEHELIDTLLRSETVLDALEVNQDKKTLRRDLTSIKESIIHTNYLQHRVEINRNFGFKSTEDEERKFYKAQEDLSAKLNTFARTTYKEGRIPQVNITPAKGVSNAQLAQIRKTELALSLENFKESLSHSLDTQSLKATAPSLAEAIDNLTLAKVDSHAVQNFIPDADTLATHQATDTRYNMLFDELKQLEDNLYSALSNKSLDENDRQALSKAIPVLNKTRRLATNTENYIRVSQLSGQELSEATQLDLTNTLQRTQSQLSEATNSSAFQDALNLGYQTTLKVTDALLNQSATYKLLASLSAGRFDLSSQTFSELEHLNFSLKELKPHQVAYNDLNAALEPNKSRLDAPNIAAFQKNFQQMTSNLNGIDWTDGKAVDKLMLSVELGVIAQIKMGQSSSGEQHLMHLIETVLNRQEIIDKIAKDSTQKDAKGKPLIKNPDAIKMELLALRNRLSQRERWLNESRVYKELITKLDLKQLNQKVQQGANNPSLREVLKDKIEDLDKKSTADLKIWDARAQQGSLNFIDTLVNLIARKNKATFGHRSEFLGEYKLLEHFLKSAVRGNNSVYMNHYIALHPNKSFKAQYLDFQASLSSSSAMLPEESPRSVSVEPSPTSATSSLSVDIAPDEAENIEVSEHQQTPISRRNSNASNEVQQASPARPASGVRPPPVPANSRPHTPPPLPQKSPIERGRVLKAEQEALDIPLPDSPRNARSDTPKNAVPPAPPIAPLLDRKVSKAEVPQAPASPKTPTSSSPKNSVPPAPPMSAPPAPPVSAPAAPPVKSSPAARQNSSSGNNTDALMQQIRDRSVKLKSAKTESDPSRNPIRDTNADLMKQIRERSVKLKSTKAEDGTSVERSPSPKVQAAAPDVMSNLKAALRAKFKNTQHDDDGDWDDDNDSKPKLK